jgi:hypothetical protein
MLVAIASQQNRIFVRFFVFVTNRDNAGGDRI